jgi:hypothetical protein
MDGVDDLHHSQATLWIQGGTPSILETVANIGRFHRLVVGKHHRDQARIRRTLNIVLPTQGMQAGARSTDVASNHRQRDQTTRVIGTVCVL